MTKAVIFGFGNWCRKYYSVLTEYFEIVAVSGSYPEQTDEEVRHLYIKPEAIKDQDCDYVLICCRGFEEVRRQLLLYGVADEKIKYGRRFLDQLEARKFHLDKYSAPVKESNTSESDQFEYPVFCRAASEEPDIFKVFRKSVIYTNIVETLTQAQGEELLDVMSRNLSVCFGAEDWKNIRENDRYGSPVQYEYSIGDEKMYLSPTTIRYAKILQDIQSLFDWKQIKTVAEIGIGYGGQARLIMEYLPIQKYYLIDLPEVIKLAGVYLDQYETRERFCLCDGTIPVEPRAYDLFISNYAFTELRREVQEAYLKSVISGCKAGYMIWNDISYLKFGGYSVEELLQVIPGSRAMEEIPLSMPDNKLIVWGTKAGLSEK